jgi:signal transduction histidine kinase
MRVGTRLVLLGAVLPTAGIVAAAWVAGQVFAHDLLRSVDEGLQRQAAVERVSLFDGPAGEPHLHLLDSPQADQPMSADGLVAVYGPRGIPEIRFPEAADVPERLSPTERQAVGPRTVSDGRGGERRELIVNLLSKNGHHYALWLALPLARLRATTTAFYRATLSVCIALALVLFVVQASQARRLSRRITAVSAHLPRLREGDLDSLPSPDPSGDEVATLRDALVEVIGQLKAARDRQERLIANAAHELRTPLGLMRTEMDLALRKERTGAELREALGEARREVDRLSALAEKLLDLAAIRGVTLEHQPGDLGIIVNEAVDACRSEAGTRGIALRVSGPSEAPAVFAPTRIRQALDNLLSNALRFAPPSTVVEVSVAPEASGWRIAVTDEGPGVPEGERDRIFEPFSRGRKETAGAGLGLAIVREVAREHGGATWVEPRRDRTEFVIQLRSGDASR